MAGPIRVLAAALLDDEAGADSTSAIVTEAAAVATERFDGLLVDTLDVARSYARATNEVRGAVVGEQHDLFVLLDTDRTSSEWKIHVFGANYDDSPEPDSDGVVRTDQIIAEEGPVAYRTRLPQDGIWDKFLVERVPVRMSHKAGGHVFNHVLYQVLRALDTGGLDILAGAVEMPPRPGMERDGAEPRTRDDVVEELVMLFAVLHQLYPAALRAAGEP